MRVWRFVFPCVTAAVLGWPSVGLAQPPDQTEALRQEIRQLRMEFERLSEQYGERLSALEAKLAVLPSQAPEAPAGQPSAATPAGAPATQTAEVPSGAAGAGGPTGALPVYGAVSAGSKVFNPDMAVIGDFLGAAGTNQVSPSPALAMHESEASFQAVVDPYARADFFMSFGEEGVELEEGYVTFPTIPGGFLVKVGQDAGGVRQGEHPSQPRAAMDGSPARHQQPRRRRGRHQRRRHVGGPADSKSVALSRSDR